MRLYAPWKNAWPEGKAGHALLSVTIVGEFVLKPLLTCTVIVHMHQPVGVASMHALGYLVVIYIYIYVRASSALQRSQKFLLF